jgi:hypothetical protein
MDIIKTYSRRSLYWILLYFGALCVLLNSFFYFFFDARYRNISAFSDWMPAFDRVHEFLRMFTRIVDPAALKAWMTPVSTGVFLFFGLLFWLSLRYSFRRLMERSRTAGLLGGATKEKKKRKPREAPKPEKTEAPDKRATETRNKRLFLHLISVYQREGRLLDFLSENLDNFDDEQIGAAVRNIHDNCRKATDKYMKLKRIVDKAEGESFTVEPGFDPHAIKLTGNVVGEPPFTGVVRHKGWRTTKIELPTLSGTVTDPGVIAPAEIEIE